MSELRFQDQIKQLSIAVRNKQPITFEAAEAAALFQGFIEMSADPEGQLAEAQEIIMRLEAQLEDARRPKLWKPAVK